MNDRMKRLYNEFVEEQAQETGRDSRVLVVDGLNLFIRSFSAVPTLNFDNKHVGGLLGFLKTLNKLVVQFNPTRCIIAFDGRDGGLNRRKKYPGYKAGRKNKIRLNRYLDLDGNLDQEEEFKRQFMRLEHYLSTMPVTCLVFDYVEADDIIGYIAAEYYANKDADIVIASADEDFFQLISDSVSVYKLTKKRIYNGPVLLEEYKLHPSNFILYKALNGDSSDNIPGVRGIGLKTLNKLFPELKEKGLTLNDLLQICQERIDGGSKLKAYRNILDATQQLYLNENIMQLQDVDIPATKKREIARHLEIPINKFDVMQFRKLFYEDGLHKVTNYFDGQIITSISKLDIYAS